MLYTSFGFDGKWIPKQNDKSTLSETNMAPENGWLED